MMPMRMRSLAPSTPFGDAKVVAKPVAIVPINFRRESMDACAFRAWVLFYLSIQRDPGSGPAALQRESQACHHLVAAEGLVLVETLVHAVIAPFGVPLDVFVDGHRDPNQRLVVGGRAASGRL